MIGLFRLGSGHFQRAVRSVHGLALKGFAFVIGILLLAGLGREVGAQPKYESYRIEKIPCTVHVVKMPRKDRKWELRSVHAFGKAVGLANVTAQLKLFPAAELAPVAGINGDFYVRRGPYAGDARGLQVVDGELISAP